MKKKLVSVLVCAAMTAAVLAGCGNKAAETTDAPAAEETTTRTSPDTVPRTTRT